MKLKVQLSDREHDVSLTFNEGNSASAAVDGRSFEVEVRELGDGQYFILLGEQLFKVRVENRPGALAASGQLEVSLGGQSFEAIVIDPRRLRSGETETAHSGGIAQIVSPMPGKIVRVLVEPGAQVEAGAGIVVVEAMKMQNEMKAPKSGTVVSINAEVGATVSAGDVLAVIE